MECGRIGSGLQAVGAAIELWALLGIVWTPWLRPKLVEIPSRVMAQARRLWPFSRGKAVTVKLGAAGTTDTAMDLRAIKRGPDDKPTASPEERIRLLVRRVATLEERLGETEQRFAQELSEKWDALVRESRAGHQELSEKLAKIESTTVRIRIKDARRFALGVSLALVGAGWGTFC